MDSETVFTPLNDVITNTLIFPENLGNLSEITNVLLISNEIEDYTVFYDSVNSNTLPIVYNRFDSTKDEVSAVLGNLSSIQRIGIAFHSSSGEKLFLEGKPLFTDSDIAESTNYSENVAWLLQVARDYNVKNIDFLACDSLNYPNWVSYFDLLHKETGVIVGASNDKTGNIKYGGDWIMESTGEDIELVYFTSSIEYYKYLLPNNILINEIYYDLNDGTLRATVNESNRFTSNITTVVIPSTVSYSGRTYSVKTIATRAFLNNAYIRTITIANSVTSIGDQAFSRCNNMTTVVYPNTVTIIGTGMFTACEKLIQVTNATGVTSIGDNAFHLCGELTNVEFSAVINNIGISGFESCSKLTSIGTSSIKGLSDYSFSHCTSLTSINISSDYSKTNIPFRCFFACVNLSSNIIIPNSVTTIDINAFFNCRNVKKVTLSPNLTLINTSAFYSLSLLEKIVFPESVTTINESAFSNCNSMNPIKFNHSVTLPFIPTTGFPAVFPGNRIGWYKSGVMPPSGYVGTTVQYLRSRNFSVTVEYTGSLVNLSSITVNGELVAEGSTTLVSNTVKTAIVTATAQNPYSTVVVTGDSTLSLGNNAFTINVISTFDEIATYYVYVWQLEPNCLLEGSKILCLVDNEEKYIPIENMRKGMLVKTHTSGYKELEMIGHSKIYNPGNKLRSKDRLYKCSKTMYPELTEDLILTGCHSILVGHLTEEQRALSIELTRDIYVTEDRYRLIACLDDRAEPYEKEGVYNIWHIALENPNIFENYGIFANGLLVETMSIRMMINFSGKELVL